jgi:hypothetical protein
MAGIAGVLMGMAACGGGGEGGSVTTPPPGDHVGAVPRSEFEALAVPSYTLLADAYGRTLRDDPTPLHLDEARFSRKLFDTVKSLTSKGAGRGSSEDSGASLLTLSDEEWRLAIAEPVGTYQTFLAKQITENTIDEIFGQEGRQRSDKVDSFRLSYWNAYSVRQLKGLQFTNEKAVDLVKRVTEAHVKAGQSEREVEMDLNNALVGRKQALNNPNANTAEFKTILSTTPAEYLSPETEILPFDFRTVYFTGWTNIDGVWSGTLTNADSTSSSEPWEAQLFINHFAGKIRGELHLFRGNEHARRRFTGDTDFANANFSFLSPYEWEINDPSPCTGMAAPLKAGGLRLVGPWTSSSCPSGGQITLERDLGMSSSTQRTGAADSGCPCSG